MNPIGFLEPEGPSDPQPPGFGMSSHDLAKHLARMMAVEGLDDYAEFLTRCVNRIKGPGEQQYSEGTHQKFESTPLEDLFEGLLEEIEDANNYIAMLHIRIWRIAVGLEPDVGPEQNAEFNYMLHVLEDLLWFTAAAHMTAKEVADRAEGIG